LGLHDEEVGKEALQLFVEASIDYFLEGVVRSDAELSYGWLGESERVRFAGADVHEAAGSFESLKPYDEHAGRGKLIEREGDGHRDRKRHTFRH